MKWESCPWLKQFLIIKACAIQTSQDEALYQRCMEDKCPIVVLFKKCDRQDGEFDVLYPKVTIQMNGKIEALTKRVEALENPITPIIRRHGNADNL